jgi:hypothetical protein
MKTIVRTILFIILVFAMVSCNTESATDINLSVTGIPSRELNKKMKIVVIGNLNSYKIGDYIYLLAYNLTDVHIQIDLNKDILVYQKNQNDLVKLSGIDFAGRIIQIPTKRDDVFGDGSYPLEANPDVMQTDSPVNLRIFVIGILCDNHDNPTNKKIGAFIDITLTP